MHQPVTFIFGILSILSTIDLMSPVINEKSFNV
jgi:hypothetical protein